MGDDDKTYRNERIMISQLDPGAPILEGFTFYECHIIGPAILGFDDTVFEDNEIVGEPDAVLWELPDGRPSIIGGIGTVRCTFTGCRFEGIGFAGGAEFMAEFRKRQGIC